MKLTEDQELQLKLLMENVERYNPNTASRLMGISRQCVRYLCQKRKLWSVKVGKTYFIPGFEIEKYMRNKKR